MCAAISAYLSIPQTGGMFYRTYWVRQTDTYMTHTWMHAYNSRRLWTGSRDRIYEHPQGGGAECVLASPIHIPTEGGKAQHVRVQHAAVHRGHIRTYTLLTINTTLLCCNNH